MALPGVGSSPNLRAGGVSDQRLEAGAEVRSSLGNRLLLAPGELRRNLNGAVADHAEGGRMTCPQPPQNISGHAPRTAAHLIDIQGGGVCSPFRPGWRLFVSRLMALSECVGERVGIVGPKYFRRGEPGCSQLVIGLSERRPVTWLTCEVSKLQRPRKCAHHCTAALREVALAPII